MLKQDLILQIMKMTEHYQKGKIKSKKKKLIQLKQKKFDVFNLMPNNRYFWFDTKNIYLFSR